MKKLFSFTLLVCMTIGLYATESNSIISVFDNTLDDWKNVPNEYLSSVSCSPYAEFYGLNGLKSMKVYTDMSYLNILLEVDSKVIADNNRLPLDIFINTDNSTTTGGNCVQYWNNIYSNIILEGYIKINGSIANYNPDVFIYNGKAGSQDWNWEYLIQNYDYDDYQQLNTVSLGNSQQVGDFFEIQITWHKIPVNWSNTQFLLGVSLSDEGWSSAGILPADYYYDEQEGYTQAVPTSPLSVTIDPVNWSSGDIITIDNIIYEVTSDTTVKVGKNSTNYNLSGDIVIPDIITTKHGYSFAVTTIGDYAFSHCSNLTSVTIGNSITTIGREAFYECFSLTSVTIGNSVTTIGDWAFSGCSGLTEVTIPSSVTTIGDYAFYKCSGLTSVTIGNSVTTIGREAFYECFSLTSVTIGNSVTTIGYEAFYNCSGLTSVTIGNSVTTIEDYAFSYCSNLTSVTIPNSVTTIGDYAFYDCTSLTSVTIPDLVTTIGVRAFSGCSGLTEVTIPDSVTTIRDEAFYQCTGLTSITIGKSVKTVGSDMCTNCSNLTSVIWNAEESGLAGLSPFFNCPISSIVFGKDVKVIPERLCYQLTKLYSLEIPQNVTTIPAQLCYECTNLTSVNLLGAINTIQSDAFYNCESLSQINLPNSLRMVENAAFMNCTNLTLNNFPTKISFIGDYAFYGVQIDSITIPSNNNKVGTDAFYNNTALKYVDWGMKNGSDYMQSSEDASITVVLNPVGLDWSEVYLYAWTSSGATITSSWPGNRLTMNKDGKYAYTFSSELSSVNIIFNNGEGLQTIDITNVRSSREYTLTYGSSKYTYTDEAYTGGDLVVGNGPFKNCKNVNTFIFGNDVSHIPAGLCQNMSNLTQLDIPNNVISIGEKAFYHCNNVTDITFGNKLESIGNQAFASCSRIDTMTIFAIVPPTCEEKTFENVSRYAYLFVPEESERKYKTDAYWSYFDIRINSAEHVFIEGTKPIITPTNNTVTLTWPIITGANAYTMTITKGDEVVCVLTFNADGQLTNIAFAAPSYDGSRQTPAATLTAQGYRFTVTGLTPGTAYEYNVEAINAAGKPIAGFKGDFSTTGDAPTHIDRIQATKHQTLKYLRNGMLIIDRNGQHYSAMGERVR